MNQISVSEVLERTWEQFKKHGVALSVVIIVLGIVISAISCIGLDFKEIMEAAAAGDDDRLDELTKGNPLVNTLTNIIDIIFTVGLINGMILLLKGKTDSVSLDMWKLPVILYVKFFGLVILLSLIIIAGLCLLIIPGIYLAARLLYSQMILIENPEMGIIEALKKSWEITKGNVWNLILLGIAGIFIIIIGFCCCCIGFIPASAYVYLASVVAYLTMTGFYTEPQIEEAE